MVFGSDEELIKQCALGNDAAFETLFRKYAQPLTHFILQIIHDKDRAQDIFQDTFLKVLKNADSFNDRYKFTTWLYRIALNLSINELRQRKRAGTRMQMHSPAAPADASMEIREAFSAPETPMDILEKKDLADRVAAAVNQLSGPKKIAFILKFYHNGTYEEIARIMDCSLGTVKSRIYYAVDKLQFLLGE